MKKVVTVLIPAYNEEDNIRELYGQLSLLMNQCAHYEWEVLFVNDGSTDGTLCKIENIRAIDARVSYINLSRNFGKENAMLAGFDYAKGDAVVIMDADLQHTPTTILEFLKKWEEGYDDVYAVRKNRGKESLVRKFLTKTYYKIIEKSSKIDALPNVGDFRLLDRKCIDALKKMREYGRYTKGMYCYIGYKKVGVEFETHDRVAGKSSMNFRKLASLAVEGITSYTIAPLRIAIWIGLIIALGTMLYILYIVIKTMVFGDPVAGFPTLMVTILFLGGVQLVALGIIGEYLGKVFEEVKRRPVYFVREYNGERISE